MGGFLIKADKLRVLSGSSLGPSLLGLVGYLEASVEEMRRFLNLAYVSRRNQGGRQNPGISPGVSHSTDWCCVSLSDPAFTHWQKYKSDDGNSISDGESHFVSKTAGCFKNTQFLFRPFLYLCYFGNAIRLQTC